jgi:hypothetical protein
MASKKLKQALMAGLAGAALAGSAKMKGEALKKGSAAIGSDAVASGIKEKTGILSRVDDFFKKKGMETDQPMFGLNAMDGAKAGKMIKATHGTMVMAKGNKLARSKPTKLS